MPEWLVIAITGLWVINLFWVMIICIQYSSLTYYQKKMWGLNWVGNIVVYGFIPFTIFWGSWVIFG